MPARGGREGGRLGGRARGIGAAPTAAWHGSCLQSIPQRNGYGKATHASPAARLLHPARTRSNDVAAAVDGARHQRHLQQAGQLIQVLNRGLQGGGWGGVGRVAVKSCGKASCSAAVIKRVARGWRVQGATAAQYVVQVQPWVAIIPLDVQCHQLALRRASSSRSVPVKCLNPRPPRCNERCYECSTAAGGSSSAMHSMRAVHTC